MIRRHQKEAVVLAHAVPAWSVAPARHRSRKRHPPALQGCRRNAAEPSRHSRVGGLMIAVNEKPQSGA